MRRPPADADWLDAAARLSLRGRPLSRPNPSVGAILVKDGQVVARGWTQAGGRPHAEAMALEAARGRAEGATLYVTLEPCAHRGGRGPACADLIADAGLARVVVGVSDPDLRTAREGIARLRQAGIEVDLLEHAASRDSLAGYLMRRTQDRPHVTLKLATSLDGRIALADGTSRWITGEVARAHVHSRRALADAILVGGRTWRADAPRLDVRMPGLEDRSPERWVLTRGPAPEGTSTLSSPEAVGEIDDALYLYVEGGAETAASFLATDRVDRIELYRAPIVIGAGRAPIGDIGLADLVAAHGRWSCVEQRRLGEDMFEAYVRQR